MRTAILLALALAGCTSNAEQAAVLEQTPITEKLYAGSYKALAACAYESLGKTNPSGLRKADLPSKVLISLDTGAVKYWELAFEDQGRRTLVRLTTTTTIWGPDRSNVNSVMAAVASCAPPV